MVFGEEKEIGQDGHSRFSYQAFGLLDDAFRKSHLELCLAAEGDDGRECGVAWLRTKIKVGWQLVVGSWLVGVG